MRDPELSGTAQRMRAICSEIDSLKFAWKVESLKFGNNKTHTRVAVQLESDAANVDPVTAMANPLSGKCRPRSGMTFPRWVASMKAASCTSRACCRRIWKCCLSTPRALLSRNLDWWEAQWENAAYLRQLLHSDVPMKPMATLVLAIGLAGKEPGQAAIAIDALVQAQRGRPARCCTARRRHS